METTFTISDSIDTCSPVGTEIVRKVSLCIRKTSQTWLTQMAKWVRFGLLHCTFQFNLLDSVM